MSTAAQPQTHELTKISHILAMINTQVMDPRVRLALEYCQDQIPEPPLSLCQIQEALALIRPGGRPCARTIQRWVKDKGFPCFFDEISDRRVYHLSACLEWFKEHSPTVSIAQAATEAAHRALLRRAGGRTRPLRASA